MESPHICPSAYKPSPLEDAAERAEHAYRRTYDNVTNGMNRAERRTARGRMIVLEAKAKALTDKIESMKESIAWGFL